MEERVHPDVEGVESAFLNSARCRGLERTFLETTAAGRVAAGDIVAICSDPGMGKTQLATAIMGHLSFDVLETISLSGLDEDLACIRLAKASRRISPNLRKGKKVGIIIDDVGPADELSVERMDRSIARLQKLGASIVITMRPEAEQILDGLERFLRIGKSDLLVHEQEIVPSNRAEAIMRESEGIPELVDVLQSHAPAFGAPETFMPAFGETLCRIAKDSLRETLLDSERASRFAAMLLGHGTWDELRVSVEGRHPDEAVAALREAVLVVVDHAAQSFRCVGLMDEIGFMYCSEMLRSAAMQWPDCAVAVAGILVGRNEVRRAARIIEWLEPERRRAFELRYGLALLNAGETALVREAMSESTYSEDVSPYALSTLSWAYDAIWSQRGFSDNPEDRVFATADDERDALRALLISRSRRLLHESSDGSVPEPFERADGVVSVFATHVEALALLEHGRVGDCCNLLRMRRPDDAGDSLGAALLAIDEEVACTLMCAEAPIDSLRMRRSEEFFERMGFAPLVGWGGIMGSVRDTIFGTVAPHGLDAATALAERRGNTVLAAALCCAVVLSDLLRRAPVSAHVRAQHAIALSERGCCGVLSDIATILQAISANCIEEPAAYRKLLHRAWSCEQIGAVGDIVCAALSEDRKYASDTPVPYDFLWLAMAISNLPEAFSGRFRSLLPPMWRKHLAELESAVRASDSPCAVEEGDMKLEPSNPPAAKGLEIRMLGKFSVLVDGEEIPSKDLVARGVGNVLALLAAAPAHSLKRVELIDSVWPGIDYVTGRNRIYQAVSRIRCLAGKIDSDIDPVIQARNDGMIRFRENQVRCDIDDFVEASRIAMGKEGSEEETLAAVQRMERLYRGNLCIPAQDGMGLVRRRDHELRRLFIDAMVLGSEAALRVGKRRLAVHYAERAHSVDGMREDIASTLIRALKASGRQDEAIRNYRSFVKKASRTKGWRPSLELREAIGTLVIDKGSPPSSPARSA